VTIRNGAQRVPSWRFSLGLSIGAGVALALAFPGYNVPLLGWVSVAGLIVATLGAGIGQATLGGLAFGAAFYSFSVPWIYTVMHEYGPLPAWQAAGVMALMILVASPYFVAFAMAMAWISRRSVRAAVWASPFLWVACEWGRSRMPDIAFPWNLLGYAASGNLALVQIASVTGIFGLSFLMACYNAILVALLLSLREKTWNRAAALGLAVLTAALVLVSAVGGRFVPVALPTAEAHLVQMNLPQSESYPANWDQLHARDMQEIRDISVNAARRQPGVIVWPEVPAPFSMEQPEFAQRAAGIARDAGSLFLLGVVDWKASAAGAEAPYNSAVMLDAQGREEFLYDKMHLVPFSEYIPWRRYFFFAKGILFLVGEFHPGTQYRVGQLDGGRFAVFICYESIFPDQVRRFVLGGAGVLINISDDGWFGRSAAPAQSLAMARVRAVENRRWLLRDTNNGLTASVDPYGRVVASMAPDVRGELDAPYAFRDTLSFYTRWGDWVAEISTLIGMLLLAWASVGGRPAGNSAASASSAAPRRTKTKRTKTKRKGPGK